MVKLLKGLLMAVCVSSASSTLAQTPQQLGQLMTTEAGCDYGFGQYGYVNCGGGGSSAPAAPRPPVVINRYGAVAWNVKTSMFDSSYDETSRSAAEKLALSKCGKGCEIVSSYWNQCTAIGYGRFKKGSYQTTGSALSSKAAEAKALAECSAKATNCEIVLSECSIYR